MTAKKRTAKSADAVILDVLAYEFPFDDRAEAERKIRRSVRYHGRRPYPQERMELLRRFKDEVQSEIHRGARSRYFAGRRGRYAAMEDFDLGRMIEDFHRSYPDMHRKALTAFAPFAVYLHHLR
jgi:hypothetical protein